MRNEDANLEEKTNDVRIDNDQQLIRLVEQSLRTRSISEEKFIKDNPDIGISSRALRMIFKGETASPRGSVLFALCKAAKIQIQAFPEYEEHFKETDEKP